MNRAIQRMLLGAMILFALSSHPLIAQNSATQEKPPSIRPRFAIVPAAQQCQPAWVKYTSFGRQPQDALLAEITVENLSTKRMTEVKLGWKVYNYPEGFKVQLTYCDPQPTYGEVLLSGTTQSVKLDALAPKETCTIGIKPLPLGARSTKTVFVDQPLLTAEDVKSLPLDGDPLKAKYVVIMYVFEIRYDDGTSWTA